MTDSELKELVTENFFAVADELKNRGIIKNERELATLLKKSQTRFSRMKSDINSYVQLEMIFRLVNDLGVNANTIFADDPKSEELLRDGVMNIANTTGSHNIIQNSKNGTLIQNNTGTITSYNAEKIIQTLPKAEREALNKYFADIQAQQTVTQKEVNSLKKTVVLYEKKLKAAEALLHEKDNKLQQTQEKLIRALEKKVSKSK